MRLHVGAAERIYNMKHSLDDFPFRIKDVEQLMGLRPRRTHIGNSDFDCIFCGGKGKMNINYTKNVYGCVRCGNGGGMIDLYADYYNLKPREAYEEIMSGLHLEGNTEIFREPVKAPEPVNVECTKASAKEIHHTYSMLLSYLTLSSKHLQDLKKRGLTEEQIEEQCYRSTPVFGLKKLVSRLLEEGCTLEGVPGFYQDKEGSWTMNFSGKNSGYLIPVRSIEGNIQGMQIRVDQVMEKRKYIWFSSGNRNMGTSSGSPVHMIGDADAEEIYVTEGPLKGTIAHYLEGKTCLCVAGVMQYKNLPPLLAALQQRKVRQVYEAYDMDKMLNIAVDAKQCADCTRKKGCAAYQGYCGLPETIREQTVQIRCPHLELKRQNIQKGCMHLYRICQELQLPCRRMVWEVDEKGIWNGSYKGIDDFYYEQNKRKNTAGQESGCGKGA